MGIVASQRFGPATSQQRREGSTSDSSLLLSGESNCDDLGLSLSHHRSSQFQGQKRPRAATTTTTTPTKGLNKKKKTASRAARASMSAFSSIVAVGIAASSRRLSIERASLSVEHSRPPRATAMKTEGTSSASQKQESHMRQKGAHIACSTAPPSKRHDLQRTIEHAGRAGACSGADVTDIAVAEAVGGSREEPETLVDSISSASLSKLKESDGPGATAHVSNAGNLATLSGGCPEERDYARKKDQAIVAEDEEQNQEQEQEQDESGEEEIEEERSSSASMGIGIQFKVGRKESVTLETDAISLVAQQDVARKGIMIASDPNSSAKVSEHPEDHIERKGALSGSLPLSVTSQGQKTKEAVCCPPPPAVPEEPRTGKDQAKKVKVSGSGIEDVSLPLTSRLTTTTSTLKDSDNTTHKSSNSSSSGRGTSTPRRYHIPPLQIVNSNVKAFGGSIGAVAAPFSSTPSSSSSTSSSLSTSATFPSTSVTAVRRTSNHNHHQNQLQYIAHLPRSGGTYLPLSSVASTFSGSNSASATSGSSGGGARRRLSQQQQQQQQHYHQVPPHRQRLFLPSSAKWTAPHTPSINFTASGASGPLTAGFTPVYSPNLSSPSIGVGIGIGAAAAQVYKKLLHTNQCHPPPTYHHPHYSNTAVPAASSAGLSPLLPRGIPVTFGDLRLPDSAYGHHSASAQQHVSAATTLSTLSASAKAGHSSSSSSSTTSGLVPSSAPSSQLRYSFPSSTSHVPGEEKGEGVLAVKLEENDQQSLQQQQQQQQQQHRRRGSNIAVMQLVHPHYSYVGQGHRGVATQAHPSGSGSGSVGVPSSHPHHHPHHHQYISLPPTPHNQQQQHSSSSSSTTITGSSSSTTHNVASPPLPPLPPARNSVWHPVAEISQYKAQMPMSAGHNPYSGSQQQQQHHQLLGKSVPASATTYHFPKPSQLRTSTKRKASLSVQHSHQQQQQQQHHPYQSTGGSIGGEGGGGPLRRHSHHHKRHRHSDAGVGVGVNAHNENEIRAVGDGWGVNTFMANDANAWSLR